MSVTEDLADALAKDVLAAVDRLGDPTLIEDIAKTLGTSSTVTQEAFMTAIRVRMADARARTLLAQRLKKAQPPTDPGQTPQ
jgi:proline dehydrogenase